MELPKYHETFLPILEILNTAESFKTRELAELNTEANDLMNQMKASTVLSLKSEEL